MKLPFPLDTLQVCMDINTNNDKWEKEGQGIHPKGGFYFDVHFMPRGSLLVVISGEK